MSFRKQKRPRQSRTGPRRMDSIAPPKAGEVLDEVLRIVHTQRARKLRRRGVVLERLESGTWVWFEHPESYLNRKMQRAIVDTFRKAARQRVPYSNAGFQMIADYYGKRWRENMERISETIRQFSIATATGYQLDEMAGLYTGRPEGLTDEHVRAYIKQGYVIKVDESPVAPGESPRITLIYQGGDLIAGGPDDPVDYSTIEARIRAAYQHPDETDGEFKERVIGKVPDLAAPYGKWPTEEQPDGTITPVDPTDLDIDVEL
jgi:hypothetical protein